MTCEEFSMELANLLEGVDCVSDASVAFSGGLDSSVVAYLVRDCSPRLYTVGFEGGKDIENAREIAELLNLEHEVVILNEDILLEGLVHLISRFPHLTPVELSFELPLYFVAKYSAYSPIYTGQGADELFGGYAKYLTNPDLMEGDVDTLLHKTIPREREIASIFGKNIETPYLSEDIIMLSRRIPVKCKIYNGVRKYVLREAARLLEIPEDVIIKEKKAAQYGSGIWKKMRKMARSRGLTVSEFIEDIKRNITNGRERY